MPYKTKDKTTIHIRLSHFLYNGLDVSSAKLDMSMSEIVRMAIYEWLKNNYTKKELDWFSDRDDMVEALIEGYREKGRAGPIETGGDIDELEEGVRKGELERYEENEDVDFGKGKKRSKYHAQMQIELIERYPSLMNLIKNAETHDLEAAYHCRKTDIETVRICLEGAAKV